MTAFAVPTHQHKLKQNPRFANVKRSRFGAWLVVQCLFLGIALLLPLILLLLSLSSCLAQEPPTLPPIEIFFSPNGGCTEAVVKEINAAKTEILVQAYSFTSVPIAKALVDAHKRGVKIQVILDKSQRTDALLAALHLA